MNSDRDNNKDNKGRSIIYFNGEKRNRQWLERERKDKINYVCVTLDHSTKQILGNNGLHKSYCNDIFSE